MTVRRLTPVLPAQTGNATKFLTTDGTTTSWATAGLPRPPALPASAPASNLYDARTGLYNATDSSMRYFRKAVNRMRYGLTGGPNVGPLRVVCCGDSTTVGFRGTTTPTTQDGAWPGTVKTILSGKGAFGGTWQHGLAVANSSGRDSRFTLGTGWAYSGGIGAGPAGISSFTANSTATGTLDFGPQACDTLKITYWCASNAGPFPVKVDGATVQTVTPNTSVNAAAQAVITFAAGTHTISIGAPSTGYIGIETMEAYSSTANATIGRVGSLGADTSTRTLGWTNSVTLSYFDLWKPDLAIFWLGTNDINDVSTTPTQYAANAAILVNRVRTNGGDALWVTPHRSAITNIETAFPNYLAALIAQADALNFPVLDIFDRWAPWTAYPSGDPYGYNGDQAHPDPPGYADVGMAVARAIEAVAS